LLELNSFVVAFCSHRQHLSYRLFDIWDLLLK
jgi:hypothetical protein